MPAGAATVEGAPHRVTLTACYSGCTLLLLLSNANVSMAFAGNRDGLFAGGVQHGDSPWSPMCSADTVGATRRSHR